ncbi:MAG: amidohydrolase [Anaerolineae bacterium]|nr:amidohydrolase [Anaerolineae bacterium]
MEKVDILLSGGSIVTMNERFDVIHDGALAIRGDSIVAVGPRAGIEARYEGAEKLDCTGRIIMPGLVNAHTHAAMTLLRGLADDLRLDVWLLGYMMPVEREFVSAEFCRLGTTLACAEMIRSGVTAFADMYYHEAEVAQATADAGVRGVLGQTVLKFPSPDAETFEDSLAYTRRFLTDWANHPLIAPAVAPHAPYSNTDDILHRCVELAKEFDAPLLIHLAEMRREVDDSLRDSGMTVVTKQDSINLFDAKVLAAHCVHIDQNEIHTLKQRNATVAHCPQSNLKLASGIAPVAAMLKAKLTVGIGTDGPASNNDLDMFEEIRLAAILAKTQANDPTVLPAREALLMATRQGAEALFIGDKTGSLTPGKRADLLVMDATPVHNVPQFERDPNLIYSRIVYAGHSADVRHVFCNGRMLLRDRELLTIDEARVVEEAQAVAVKIDAFLRAREQNVLGKLVAIGGLQRSESFEVQMKAALPDESALDKLLLHPDVQIVRAVHYRQFDTYFLFEDESQGRVRYREDDLLDENGEMISARTRLTLTMPVKERTFDDVALLSRSRFIADAAQPLRFYREYFKPEAERELEKDRRRWHLLYQGVLFYLNVDRVIKPALPGTFVEIKSRTWSARDAEVKAERISDMLRILGLDPSNVVKADYLDWQELAAQ